MEPRTRPRTAQHWRSSVHWLVLGASLFTPSPGTTKVPSVINRDQENNPSYPCTISTHQLVATRRTHQLSSPKSHASNILSVQIHHVTDRSIPLLYRPPWVERLVEWEERRPSEAGGHSTVWPLLPTTLYRPTVLPRGSMYHPSSLPPTPSFIHAYRTSSRMCYKIRSMKNNGRESADQ